MRRVVRGIVRNTNDQVVVGGPTGGRDDFVTGAAPAGGAL